MRAELHKLCEFLRRHFPAVKTDDGVDIWDAERLMPLLKMRLQQMQACVQLGMWSDALITADDAYAMMEVRCSDAHHSCAVAAGGH